MLFSLSISLRSHTFRLRSYTFRRGFRNDLLIFHTFLYVLSNPYAISEKMYSNHTFLYVLCNPPTNSKKVVLKSYVPIRSEQPSRSSCLICYVRTRSGYVPTRSTNEFEKKLRFPYVPKRSVQQYRKSLLEKKN